MSLEFRFHEQFFNDKWNLLPSIKVTAFKSLTSI